VTGGLVPLGGGPARSDRSDRPGEPGRSRGWRRALTAAAVLAAVGLAPGAVAPASAAPRQDGGAAAVTGGSAVAGCLRDSGRLAVSFVVDESRSLRSTDPDAQRVQAALAALDGLAELAGSVDGTTVEVAVATFGDPFVARLPFTELTAESDPVIRRTIRALARQTAGTETDLVTALAAARDGLNEHTAEVTAAGDPAPCSTIVLFTDGGYRLLPRTGGAGAPRSPSKAYAPGQELRTEAGIEAAEAAGIEVVCRPDGLADQIRADDISLTAVMLAAEPTAADEDLLRAIATGTGGKRTCGRPDATNPGSFLAARDADLLVAGFDELAVGLNGGAPVSGDTAVTICGTEACPSATRTVEVDPLTRRLRILTLAPEPGLVVEVEGPAGTARIDEPGPVELGGVTGTARAVAGRGFAVDLDRPTDGDDAWVGTWTVRLTSAEPELVDAPALIRAYTYTDLAVELSVPTLTRGEDAAVEASLAIPAQLDPADLIATGRATARFDDPMSGRSYEVPLDGPAAGPYTGAFAVPADLRANAVSATVTVTVTYRAGGTATDTSAPADALVRRPGDAVQFAPGALELPTLSGDGAASSTLLAVGGKVDGCVWFDAPELTGPVDAGALTVTYDGAEAVGEDACIAVPAGSTTEIEVAVSPEHRATGSLRGHLVVHEKVGGAETVTDVAVVGNLYRGVDQARRLLLAAGLVAGGLLLPMALLFLINAAGARFQRLDAVRAAAVPVRVSGRTVEALVDGRARRLSLEAGRFTSLADAGTSREFTFGGIRFRARPSKNPFGATVALAAPEGGAEKLKGGIGRKVELDAGLAGSWIFLLDPDRTRRGRRGTVEGRVIAFLHERADARALARLLDDIERRLPTTADELGQAVWDKTLPTKGRVERDPAAAEPEAEPEPEPDVSAEPAAEADGEPGPGAADGA